MVESRRKASQKSSHKKIISPEMCFIMMSVVIFLHASRNNSMKTSTESEFGSNSLILERGRSLAMSSRVSLSKIMTSSLSETFCFWEFLWQRNYSYADVARNVTSLTHQLMSNTTFLVHCTVYCLV